MSKGNLNGVILPRYGAAVWVDAKMCTHMGFLLTHVFSRSLLKLQRLLSFHVHALPFACVHDLDLSYQSKPEKLETQRLPLSGAFMHAGSIALHDTLRRNIGGYCVIYRHCPSAGTETGSVNSTALPELHSKKCSRVRI